MYYCLQQASVRPVLFIVIVVYNCWEAFHKPNTQYIFIFSPNEQRAGGGEGCAARLFLFLFFSVQQTTSGIGHRVK